MKNLKNVLILFLCLFAGGIIRSVIDFPIPDVVYGMFILLVLLIYKVVKLEDAEPVSKALLENLAFLFLPLSVSLMIHLDVLGDNIVPILVISLVSTFLTMGVTSFVVQYVQRRMNK